MRSTLFLSLTPSTHSLDCKAAPEPRERRWFVLERLRRDTNGGSETEVTVTSKLPANAERNKEIEKIQERYV